MDTDQKRSLNWRRIWPYLVLAGGLVLVLVTGYFLLARFLHDRETALGFDRMRPEFNRAGKNQRTYTAKELEDAQKKGLLPKNQPFTQPYQPPNTTNNDAAVQRSLRTIEEINRINEMNRRLQEEQQRMQKQN